MRLLRILSLQYVLAVLVGVAAGVAALLMMEWPVVKGLLWGGVPGAVLLGTGLGLLGAPSTAPATAGRRLFGAVLGFFIGGNFGAALVLGGGYLLHLAGSLPDLEVPLAVACTAGAALGMAVGFARPR